MKIGIVTLKKLDGDAWRMNYVDPFTGHDVRRKVFCTEPEARNICRWVNDAVARRIAEMATSLIQAISRAL